jgi:oligopeptide transport system ATP-binding protein
MNKDSKVLTVKDLHVSFYANSQQIHAVRGVSFDLYKGERLGIVGESGSGKSVLVKTLMRLLPLNTSTISQGSVLYNNQDLTKLSEKMMQNIRGKKIGMIFQDPMTSLNPTLRIGYQIAEGFRAHHPNASYREARAHVLELIQKVGIAEPLKRFEEYPHTLSGGLRQRVMIAIALASQPEILIADEPTTALDVTIQAQILALIKQIQTDKSLILITHDLSVIAGFCDRVLVMYGGKIVEEALVGQLFSDPKHPYTQKLLQSIPRLDDIKAGALKSIEGSPPDPTQPILGCPFTSRCPQAMNICPVKAPPYFPHLPHHQSACWLHDPRRVL